MSWPSLRLSAAPRLHACAPDWSWAPPPLVDHDLWCVIAGAGTLELRGCRHSLESGSCVVYAPGDQPRVTHDPRLPLIVFFAHFEPGDAGVIPPEFRRAVEGVVLRVPRLAPLRVACEEIVEAALRDTPADCRLVPVALLHLMYRVASDSHGQLRAAEEDRLWALARAVQARPGREWTVDEMARQAGWSRAQFDRRFRASVGMAPLEYVIACRMETAVALLRETTLPVNVIAMQTGWMDAGYFARRFRARYGQTPGRFRAG